VSAPLRLPVRELTAAAFAPYGRVIDQPSRPDDASGPGWRWWAETVLLPTDGRPFGVGYLSLEPAPLSFDWAERHMRTVEVIAPMGDECLVYVGPPEHRDEPDRLPPLESFEVFRVRPGAGVALDPAVWHGAPLAERAAVAMVLILEGTGREDVTVVRFEDTPVSVGRNADEASVGMQEPVK
jgi:ureidoglycolate lyase